MTLYYKLSDDGTHVVYNTADLELAEQYGATLSTELPIVYGYDGKQYVQGTEPEKPLSIQDFDDAMEAHLKEEQLARGYTTRSPAEYANSKNVRWHQDSQDWIDHITEVMEYGLSVQNHYNETGEGPTLEEFIANIPAINWTYAD